MALTTSGQVYGWGSNGFGQVGCNCRDFYARAKCSPLEIHFPGDYKIDKILCYEWTSFVITSEGQVFMWGRRSGSKCFYKPKLMQHMTNIKHICLDYKTIYLLSNDGVLYLCDLNQQLVKIMTTLRLVIY